jgi:iron complex transport system substrate-binding protein
MIKRFHGFYSTSALCMLVCVIVYGCFINSSKQINTAQGSRYACTFGIRIPAEGDTLLDLKENFFNNSDAFTTFRLSRSAVNSNDKKIKTIKIPLRKIVCMSTSHIAYLNALGKLDNIVAVSGGQYINNKEIIKRMNQGAIKDVGYESSLNYEMILSLNPDMVFTYGINGENNTYIEKLRQLGIPVMVLGDYTENHPLGKLEYIRLFGYLTGVPVRADSIFISKSANYAKIREAVPAAAQRPQVLLNAPWKETWYIPGGDNYISKLINDAGADVLGAEKGKITATSYNTEQIYHISSAADFWLHPNSYSSIKALTGANTLFKEITALKRGKVYNNIKRVTAFGGSDFWESGVVDPDIILKDLVSIFHPELLPGYEPVYYIHLK